MDEVEARPFIEASQVGVSERGWSRGANETSLLISPGFAGCRSRQKVLVIGDKRLKIYPSYRLATTRTNKRRSPGTAYRGVPRTDTADTRHHGVSVARREPSETADIPGRSSENVSRTDDDDDTCIRDCDEESGSFKPVRTEWKLVWSDGYGFSDGLIVENFDYRNGSWWKKLSATESGDCTDPVNIGLRATRTLIQATCSRVLSRR